MSTSLRCGRLDEHQEHEWQLSPWPYRAGSRTYHCQGAPVIEGGHWAEQDAADDAAEEWAIRERRESA